MPVEINEILSKAWSEVEKASIPADLNETAFREAIRLLSDGVDASGGVAAKTVNGAAKKSTAKKQTRSASTSKTTSARARAKPAVDDSALPDITEDEFFRKLEEQTGVDRDKLEQVLYLDGKTPRVNLVARKLGDDLKSRMVAVARILPVARQYGLDEDATSFKVVRDECTRLKCLDTNVNKYVGGLDGILYSGGRSKVLKVRPDGVKAFSKLVDELLSESSSSNDEA